MHCCDRKSARISPVADFHSGVIFPVFHFLCSEKEPSGGSGRPLSCAGAGMTESIPLVGSSRWAPMLSEWRDRTRRKNLLCWLMGSNLAAGTLDVMAMHGRFLYPASRTIRREGEDSRWAFRAHVDGSSKCHVDGRRCLGSLTA